MPGSFRCQGLQHARLLCPSLSSRVCSNSCPLSWWCHPTISSSVILFSSFSAGFPSIKVFSNESAVCIRWPKYWSFTFSISPSNEHSGSISFRIDWFDLLAVQGTLSLGMQELWSGRLHKRKSFKSWTSKDQSSWPNSGKENRKQQM